MPLPLRTNKTFLVIACLLFMQYSGFGQGKAGFELYNYSGEPTIQPVCHIQSNKNWYAELRYNYEDARTFSAYGGKTFDLGKDFSYSLTPMVGISLGQFTGISLATNADAEWKNLFFSSQTQYSHALKDSSNHFFFSWSEIGYSFGDHVFAGATLQYTLQTGLSSFEPGVLLGVSVKNISFPFYVFKPFHSSRYFVLGVNIEYSLKKKK